jgi:phosphotransferase system HPr (HPr) family protein
VSADPSQAADPAAPVVRRQVTICNKLGLHARAAKRIVMTAAQFDADIRVRKNGTEASAGEILDLLLLGAAPGAIVELSATGAQAEAAVAALANLIECKFDED